MSVLQSLILVLALAAPLSALTCQQCLYYDDTDATDTQKAIITGIQTAQATTKCGTNQTAEACDDSTMDACFSTVLKSKLGGNTTMCLQHLRLYSLQRRRERYTIIHLWKVYKGLSPNDLGLTFYEHQRLGPQCKRPKINGSSHIETLKFNSFVSKGPALFNIIPKDVKCFETEDPTCDQAQRFKNSLDKFLKKFPDTPPTPGYIAINGNSLLEWVTSRHIELQGGAARHA